MIALKDHIVKHEMQKEERCPSVSIMLADLSASSVENAQNEQNENLTKKSNETQVIKKTHKNIVCVLLGLLLVS